METLEVGIVITSAHDSSTPYAGNSYYLIFLAVWISKGLSHIGIYMALFHHTTNYYKKELLVPSKLSMLEMKPNTSH